jgi:hypothetical protein
MHTTRPSLRSWQSIRGRLPRLWGILNHLLDPSRPQEHAIPLLTLEIPLPLDGAIVLATVLLKFDTDPISSLEVCRAKKSDGCDAVIVQFDALANGEGRGGGHARRVSTLSG